MILNKTWQYLAMVALLGAGACSPQTQVARKTAEVDDLYGNSGDAAVYAGDDRRTTQQNVRQASRFNRRQGQLGQNLNPDYAGDQQTPDGTDADYYTELSARNVQRGISADPGWGSSYNDYNTGFANGYSQGLYGANSWNRWGMGGVGLLGGLSLGFGSGFGYGLSPLGYSPFNYGYSPFGFGGYNSFAYGGGFYDPFYSPFGYGGGFGYSPFGYGYGGGYGYSPYAFYGSSLYNRPTYVNSNYVVTGADPYRNNTRTYGPRSGSSARYSGDFNNTAPAYNGGRRSNGYGSSSYNNANTGTGNNTYYSNSNTGRGSSRGAGSYSNGGSSSPNGGRTYGSSSGSYTPSTSGSYYERPSSRQGAYTNSYNSGSGSSRGSYSAPQRTYSAPSQQSYSQPSYNNSNSRTYSAPAPTYSAPSAPSYSAPSSGGGGGGGYSSGAGSSRGPR